MAQLDEETKTLKGPTLNPNSDAANHQHFDDAKLALQGIHMILNNEWKEAEELFMKHKDYSPLMCSGCSFVLFMQALMTYEDEKIAQAIAALEETQNRCEKRTSFIKSRHKKHSKTATHSFLLEILLCNRLKFATPTLCVPPLQDQADAVDKLHCQIIAADSLLYRAILTFMSHDFTSYIKGGWILRKAWKIYEHAYKVIKHMNDGKLDNGMVATSSSRSVSPDTSSIPDLTSDSADVGGSDATSGAETGRLLGSVSFGYGLFQLCISMVPPKLLKVIEFLGFEGDRDTGLDALEYACQSDDMKAPLATLGLLWYHTVIRPFFSLDGSSMDAGVDKATAILERCEKEYPKSALFLFFNAKIHRLKGELAEAMSACKVALDVSTDQREIQLICLHEIGWMSMMMLDWKQAVTCFIRLWEDNRWSKSYYAYMAAICQGATGDVATSQKTLVQVPGLVRRKNSPIETFVTKRTKKLQKSGVSREHCTLRCLEVLFLWNSMSTCRHSDLEAMLEVCNQQTDKKLFHLRSLIEGALYRELGDAEMAVQCFREAIARQEGMKDDLYVAAYALYELGGILMTSPQTWEEGSAFLHKAKAMSDYDFEGRLNIRIYAALKRERPADKTV